MGKVPFSEFELVVGKLVFEAEVLAASALVEMITLKKILLRDNVDNEESMRNRQGEDGDVDDNDYWEVEHKATIGFGGRKKTSINHLARRDS